MTDHNNIEEGTPLVSYQNSDEIAPENVAETLAPRSTKLVLATIAAVSMIALGTFMYSMDTTVAPLTESPVTKATNLAINVSPDYRNTVQYAGYDYATLIGNYDKNSMSYVCAPSGNYYNIPAGWEIAPNDANTHGVLRAYGWNFHVLMIADGCGYGTKQYSQGAWSCGIGCEAAGCRARYCSTNFLIRRSPPPPTPYPIANPTHMPTNKPIAHPTQEPTFEPTGRPQPGPTNEPIAHPTLAPTQEPSQDPTLAPIPDATEPPSLEPTFSPTVAATEEPKEEPGYCDYEYESGVSKADGNILPGCAMIAANDLNFLKKGEVSNVVYVCTDDKFTVDTEKLQLSLKGKKLSWIKAGPDAVVTFTGPNDETGKIDADTEDNSLVHLKYATSGERVNDNIVKIELKSYAAKVSKLPAECSDIHA